MSRESIENKVVATQDIEGRERNADILENSYQRYLELGGIINKKDYQSVLDGMNKTRTLDRENLQVSSSIQQALGIARYAEIKLNDSKDVLDPKIVLYITLRNDAKPEDVEYHHSQMSDQHIFGEVLRILGDADSLDKLIKVYPNISFKYKRGE
ncbi:MAG: hypothetical protein NT136_02250 [Candidatus Moranbacteria bacterium]|nr:hypothetical protein [Candidatus Moranbacteria bacterium]